jgi:hypothetical protein
MWNVITLSLIAGSITFLSSLVIILTVYLHKKSKRTTIWEAPTNIQPIINSAPISRRTSTSCLINLDKQPPPPSRSRSASFSEDLSARLQILAAGSNYRSYSPAIVAPSPRAIRPSLGANIRFPIASNISSKPSIPSITFQLRYDNTIETLFITIFQLQNYLPIKNSPNIFLILYLLPNDDEQQQTQSSTNGVFNEHFHFPLKSDELTKRTLRLTVYTVGSTTRVRNTLGHVFIKFDQFIEENKIDKTFSTNTLSECLVQDLKMRSDYLGELILTNTYFKEKNLIQIRIQQINHLHIDLIKTNSLLKAHFSGQITNTGQQYPWTNTTTFIIPSSPSFRIDQELILAVQSSIISTNERHIDCHLRLHLHGAKQIHSHARWQHSLRSNSSNTLTVPLMAT